MATTEPTAGRPSFQPLPEHDTLNTALLLWHVAKNVAVSSSGCWEWPVDPDKKSRYGSVWYGKRSTRVHRLIYELCVAPIPDDVGVLHRCDNPPCCNPAHLFLGDQQANVDDCVDKGRFVQNVALGESNGASRLDEGRVRSIRRAARLEGASNALARRLAKQHGVAVSTIKGIVAGRAWKHVKDEDE